MASLDGSVQRIVFSNPETQFAVARMSVGEGTLLGEQVTIVGVLPGIRPGQDVHLEGRWEEDPRFGRQFRVESFHPVEPTSPEAIERFLASGLLHGVGPITARRIVEHFGADTLDVLRRQPHRLAEVEGIGLKRARRIAAEWQRHGAAQEAMVFLAGHGISTGLAARIYAAYGPDTARVVREDPYRLAEEIHGIGFRTADSIARALGVAADAPRRLEAGLLHVLGEAADQGDVFVTDDALRHRAAEALDVDPGALAEPLDRLVAAHKVVAEVLDPSRRAVFLPALHRAECAVARRLRAMLQHPVRISQARARSIVAEVERQEHLELADEQRRAVETALRQRVLVVTGGPGTGKTTVVRSMCAALELEGLRLALCAPTGRAAKRVAEATGREARTIHRLLEYSPRSRRFERNADAPLAVDAVIVDEASMVDIALAQSLVEAIPPSARLVLVGDVNQLPPVGPGSPLQHIIDSGTVPVVRLERIFRQAEASLIVRNAHRILAGELPEAGDHQRGDDFFLAKVETPAAAVEMLRRIVVERIPAAFGLDPVDDVQVLTPMHRGELGASNLNEQLRAWLNPEGATLQRGSRLFRVGDKVMQVRNNYDKDVFNGDVGRVCAVHPADGAVEVRFDDRMLLYEASELDELEPAWAVTVHKAQGSEYPAVVVVLHTQHYVMLRRNLLYTALTRARRLAVLVGNEAALRLAVAQRRLEVRAGRLAERLRGDAPC